MGAFAYQALFARTAKRVRLISLGRSDADTAAPSLASAAARVGGLGVTPD